MRGTDATTGKPLDGIAHLKQSIRDILTTPLGSRVMRRTYGSRLFELVDAPLTPNTIADIYAATVEALTTWEPRIYPQRVRVNSVNGVLSSTGKTGTVQVITGTVDQDARVSGTISPNATGLLLNAGVPLIDGQGIDAYSTDGKQTPAPSGRWTRLFWSPADGVIIETYMDGVRDGQWGSLDAGSGDTPTIDIRTAGNWFPIDPATGFPSVQKASRTQTTVTQAPPSFGRIEIDLEALYLPDGRVLTIDGISFA